MQRRVSHARKFEISHCRDKKKRNDAKAERQTVFLNVSDHNESYLIDDLHADMRNESYLAKMH
jgi:hypothetical protein